MMCTVASSLHAYLTPHQVNLQSILSRPATFDRASLVFPRAPSLTPTHTHQHTPRSLLSPSLPDLSRRQRWAIRAFVVPYATLALIPTTHLAMAAYHGVRGEHDRVRGNLFYSLMGALSLPLSVLVLGAAPFVYAFDWEQRTLYNGMSRGSWVGGGWLGIVLGCVEMLCSCTICILMAAVSRLTEDSQAGHRGGVGC